MESRPFRRSSLVWGGGLDIKFTGNPSICLAETTGSSTISASKRGSSAAEQKCILTSVSLPEENAKWKTRGGKDALLT